MRRAQKNQDRLWDYFQNYQTEVFDLSYPRLGYFASKCKPWERVLNVGIGNGLVEKILLARGISVQTLDPSDKALKKGT